MNKLLTTGLIAAVLPVAASAQTTLAGWTFSQFLGEGYPSISGETGEPVSYIAATYRGAFNPDSNVVDGTLVGSAAGPGYNDPVFGAWDFSNFENSGGVEVRADTLQALNFANSLTLDGKNMALTDTQGTALTFALTNTLWSISTSTTGFTNVDGANNDFTFAARSAAGATVEWLYNGSVFATTNVAANSNFGVYGFDFAGDGADFYSTGTFEGRVTSGVVSFDNVQVNGQAVVIPEPSSFAALAGLVGLGFAASRRRRA